VDLEEHEEENQEDDRENQEDVFLWIIDEVRPKDARIL